MLSSNVVIRAASVFLLASIAMASPSSAEEQFIDECETIWTNSDNCVSYNTVQCLPMCESEGDAQDNCDSWLTGAHPAADDCCQAAPLTQCEPDECIPDTKTIQECNFFPIVA